MLLQQIVAIAGVVLTFGAYIHTRQAMMYNHGYTTKEQNPFVLNVEHWVLLLDLAYKY